MCSARLSAWLSVDVAALHEERPEDRGDHADEGDRQREHQQLDDAGDRSASVGGDAAGEGDERDRGDDRAGVRLEQVGAHAGDVADVVADVVGDGGRVARVVLGDARLDLADEVGADVGGLGVDAAADAREQRDRRGAEAEGRDDLERVVDLEPRDEHEVGARVGRAAPRPATEKPITAPPRNATGERLPGAVLGGFGGAGVGHGGHGHADVPGAGREHGAEDVGDRGERGDHHGEQHRHHDHEHRDPLVLLLEERLGAVLDLGHQEDHALVAGRGRSRPPCSSTGEPSAAMRRDRGEIRNGFQGRCLLRREYGRRIVRRRCRRS